MLNRKVVLAAKGLTSQSNQVECKACGAVFRSKEQLEAHVKQAHPSMMNMDDRVGRSFKSNYLKWGLLGGFTGAIFMALVMIGAVYAAGTDGVAVVCSMGVALIGLQPTSAPTTVLGLVLHLVMGTVIGAILASVTLLVGRQLKLTSTSRGLGVGLLGGFVVFLVLGLPTMFYVMLPAMVQVMGMMSSMPAGGAGMAASEQEARMMIGNMIGPLVGAWLVAHLAFGGIWGTINAYGTRTASLVR